MNRAEFQQNQIALLDIAIRDCFGGNASKFARAIGVTPQVVLHWRTTDPKRWRPVSVDRCFDIETACGGRVTRQLFRPDDWHRKWPDLMESTVPTT